MQIVKSKSALKPPDNEWPWYEYEYNPEMHTL